jgi:mono/diheme cytochrome c family protein
MLEPKRSTAMPARLLIALTALAASAAPALALDGKAVFEANCSACHQLTGKGVPGAFPALAGDKFVLGPPEPVAKTVLNGRGGMPKFGADLSDDEIAAALSYVRSAWGNAAPPVTVATVSAERTAAGLPPPTNGMQAH